MLLFACCKPDPVEDPSLKEIELSVPAHFPKPVIPADNPLTQAKIDLGKKLFFDPILSKDRSVSCSSCHLQANAFSDPRKISLGVNNVPGTRNAPPLFNLVYHKSFFWDGSNPMLETQALFPIEAPFEMNLPIDSAIARLKRHSEYPKLFAHAFGDSIGVSVKGLTDALSCYERSLLSTTSKYDRFIQAGFDSTVFTPVEWKGYKLFFAESAGAHAECFHCHNGPNMDDPEGKFRNNGLYLYYEDLGRYNVTGSPFDIGKFKVPSLRNVEYTAPYMHDGSLPTLEAVLDHYGSGGQLNQNRDVLMGNIILSAEEKQAIIAFLKTLSDPGLLTNPAYAPD